MLCMNAFSTAFIFGSFIGRLVWGKEGWQAARDETGGRSQGVRFYMHSGRALDDVPIAFSRSIQRPTWRGEPHGKGDH